jgi:hypothetical protein
MNAEAATNIEPFGRPATEPGDDLCERHRMDAQRKIAAVGEPTALRKATPPSP